MDTEKLLIEFCNLSGPSGFEGAVAEICTELLSEFSDDITTDVMGNVIAKIPCGIPGAKKVMLDAHMDEIGLIVSAHDKGFLKFDTIGGIDPRMLPGREVLILAGEEPLLGIIACLPPHLLTPEHMEESIPIKDMYIDTGFGEEEAKSRIPIGTPIVFRDHARKLQNDVICGKAMDDRACIVSILKALHLLKGKKLAVDLIIVAGVQEEVGVRGAGPATYVTEPDYSLVIDVTHAHTPDSKLQTNIAFGGGPELSIGPNADRPFTKRIQNTAKDKGIPCQLGIHSRQSGTNADPIQISRGGVITAVLGLPLRYMHSPVETLRVKDVEYLAELIAATIESFDGACK